MKKVMFVVQSVLFLMMLSGCWITEKGHVKSLFKDYWKAYDPKSKLTGIYVYETKKPHVFDVEYTYSWEEHVVYCRPEKKSLYDGEVLCLCPKSHRTLEWEHADGAIVGCCEVDNHRFRFQCAEKCKGHLIENGSAKEKKRVSLGPDGKLYDEWGNLL